MTNRNVRNNNPLNLEYRNQPGTTGTDGRFGIYRTPEDGFTAATRQIQLYQDRDGLNTPRQIIGKWAPAGENDPNGYAAQVYRISGLDPNGRIDTHDSGTMTRLTGAMAQVEGGTFAPDVINRGVGAATNISAGGSGEADPFGGAGGDGSPTPTNENGRNGPVGSGNSNGTESGLPPDPNNPNDFGGRPQPGYQPNGSATRDIGEAASSATAGIHAWFRRIAIALLALAMLAVAFVALTRSGAVRGG